MLHRGCVPKEAVEVYVPDSVKMIDDSCFAGASVKSIRFSAMSHLTFIGHSAFDGSDLKKINFPAPLRFIGVSAFNQTALEVVNLSDTDIEHIGSCAFANCAKLMKAELPDSVEMLPNGCFYSCRQLMKINLKKVRLIDKDAFRGCDDLIKVERSAYSNIEYIGEGNEPIKTLL